MHTRRLSLPPTTCATVQRLVALAKAHRIVTASHDDATLAHVEEAIAEGGPLPNFRPRPKPPRPAIAPALPY